MIPNINISDVKYNTVCINSNEYIPEELAEWINIKVNKEFVGKPITNKSLHYMQAYINFELRKLVEQRYILFSEGTWSIVQPLFRWERDE